MSRDLLILYFIHGLSFSILLTIFSFAWILFFALVVAAASLVGVIIGIFVLFFITGWLNASLTEKIWDTPVRSGLGSTLSHGFVLWFSLVIVHLPSLVLILSGSNYAFAIAVGLFFINSLVDGFVAKSVATVWRYRGYNEMEEETLEEIASKRKCSECGHPIPSQSFKFCPSCGELVSPESEV